MTTNTPIRRLRVYAATDAGRARAPQNEDSYALSPALSPEQDRDKGYLYVLADGMGGYQAGEVASAIVTRVLPAAFYADPDTDIAASLERAIASAEREIKADQQANSAHAQMGSTVVAVVIRGNEVVVSNVGDSRCYRLRNGRLKLLSVDHSWVGEQVRNKVLTEQEAREHPYRSVLNRALGQATASSKPDTTVLDWQPGDRLLLCSDGLWDMVPDQRIAETLVKLDAREASKKLIDEANAAGGEDNITVVIIADDAGSALPAAVAMHAPSGATTPDKTRPIVLPLMAFALVTLCVGSGLFAAINGATIVEKSGLGGAKITASFSSTPTSASAGNAIFVPTATLAPMSTAVPPTPTKTPTPTHLPPTATSTATSSPTPTPTLSSERPTLTPTPTATLASANAERAFGKIEVCNYIKTENKVVKCAEKGGKLGIYVLPDLSMFKPDDMVTFRWVADTFCGVYSSTVKNLRLDPHVLTKINEGDWQIDVFLNGRIKSFIAFNEKDNGSIEQFDISNKSPKCVLFEECNLPKPNKDCKKWN